MTYVIAQGCCNDSSCVSVCPVDCIRPRPGDPDFMSAEQLYIDPASCIDCAACMAECPVGAVYDEYDMPDHLGVFKEINAEYFVENPLDVRDSAKAKRRRLPEGTQLRVAVIGSGPSGCYAVDQLSSVANVHVDLFERWPTPFGLARTGVAPDHQTTKDVTKFFSKVIRRPNVSCYFNVEVGKDVTLDEVTASHHAVVVAVGADTDRRLHIDGEDLPGSYSARQFVSWYNSHPEHSALEFDLDTERVVIVGNGNVALDVARVLVSKPDDLTSSSDIAQHTLDALRKSNVKEVVVAARRGVLDAAYTTSEVMALARLDGVDLVALPDEVAVGDDSRLDKAQARRKHAVAASAVDPDNATSAKRITLRFGLKPEQIVGDTRVESVNFRTAEGTETIETGLVLRAIGYRSSPVEGVPFDERTGTIDHVNGRVQTRSGIDAVAGIYCVGWAKRGPTGVIGTNQVCARETVSNLFDDFESGQLGAPTTTAAQFDAVVKQRKPDMVDRDTWAKIDRAELERGKAESRPRVKFVSIDDMLSAVR